MGGIWKVQSDLHAAVPATFKFYCCRAEQIPDNTAEPAAVVDVIYDNSCLRSSKMKFLVYFSVLCDIFCVLDAHVVFKEVT